MDLEMEELESNPQGKKELALIYMTKRDGRISSKTNGKSDTGQK